LTPEEFSQILQEYGIQLSIEQQEQFARYFYFLVEWNNRMNLTAITEENEVYLKHFFDSLAPIFLGVIASNDPIDLLDIGAGAGFPSIPMKILFPKLKVTIIDSLNKRIIFLKELAKALGLEEVRFYHGRAEDFGQNVYYRERYSLVTARAVARLNVLSELTLPFLKKGGRLIALKASQTSEEVRKAKKAIALLGGKIAEEKGYSLPVTQDSRFLVVVKKEGITPKKYPRKAGTPNKKPIV
jgi:16S rRNA (guanine527-N7)-methyltransferase